MIKLREDFWSNPDKFIYVPFTEIFSAYVTSIDDGFLGEIKTKEFCIYYSPETFATEQQAENWIMGLGNGS